MKIVPVQKKYSDLTDGERLRFLESLMANFLLDHYNITEEGIRELFNDTDKAIDFEMLNQLPIPTPEAQESDKIYDKLTEIGNE